MSTTPITAPFQKGDEIVLNHGTYEGTLGSFLELKADPKWADILERNGKTRSHPVEWLSRNG